MYATKRGGLIENTLIVCVSSHNDNEFKTQGQ